MIKVQIFASDIYLEALEVARLGVYPANIVRDVVPVRREPENRTISLP